LFWERNGGVSGKKKWSGSVSQSLADKSELPVLIIPAEVKS